MRQLLLCLWTIPLWAGPPSIAVLPKAGNPENSVAFYDVVSLKLLSRIPDAGGADILQIIPLPDGSKFFLISKSNSPVIALDENYANPKEIAGRLGVAPSAAILTPDAKRLLVAAGTNLNTFQTATNELSNTITLPSPIVDLAASHDSARIFALGQSLSDGKIQLTMLENERIVNTLTLPGDRNAPATSLLMAPNGRLYLSTDLRVFEIDSRTNQLTPRGEILTTGYPGKGAAASPDGRYIMIPNVRPLQGATPLLQLDTRNKTIYPAAALPGQEPFERIQPSRNIIGAEGMIGLTRNGRLFDIRFGNPTPSVTPSTADAYFAEGTTAHPNYSSVAFSNEFFPRKLAVIKTEGDRTALFSVDLLDQRFARTALPNLPWRAALVTPSAPAGTTLRMLQINTAQIVPAGLRSPLPLVVRCVEPEGKGVFRAPVTFTTSTPGVSIESSSVLAGVEGYAQTYVTAPDLAGSFTITANTPGAPPLTFTIGVPNTPNGADLSGLFVSSGNGQVVRELSRTVTPMVTQLRDLNGVPVAREPIRWIVKQGLGGFNSASTTTDANGFARAFFNGDLVTSSTSYTTTIVEAASNTGRATFFVTTTPASIPSRGIAPDPVITILYPNFDETRSFTGPAGGIVRNAIGIRVTNAVGPDVGMGLPNVGLRGSISEGPISAECNTESLSDATGFLNCDLKLGPRTGLGTLQFNAGEYRDLPTAQLIVTIGGPASVSIVTGNNQSAVVNQTLPTPLTARVTDAGGNVLNNIPVRWTVSRGTAVLSSATSTTDSNGNTSIRATLGATPGPVTIRATVASDVSAAFTQTATITYGGLRIVSGDGQSAMTDAVFAEPLDVEVRDSGGAIVPGVPVQFTVSQGETVLNAASAITDNSGIARVTATAGAAAGLSTVTASIDRFAAVFSLRTRPRAPFVNEITGLSPCGLASINGSFLASGVSGMVSSAASLALPTSLGPVESVTVDGVAAGIASVSNASGIERIVIQTPCETATATAQVAIKVAGLNATTVSSAVSVYQPAILLESVPTTPVKRGSVLRILATGLGQTQPPILTRALGVAGQVVTATVSAGVNDQGARVVRAEYLSGQAGVYAVEIEIPADVEVGPNRPLVIAVSSPAGGDPIYAMAVTITVD